MRSVAWVPVLMALCATSLFGQASSDLDASVIAHLRKAGSNVSKPHDIEFFLYFKTKDSATRASRLVAKEGCKVSIEPGADKTSWLCDAKKRMIPVHSELVRLRKRFEAIAKKYRGQYDGWETAVVK